LRALSPCPLFLAFRLHLPASLRSPPITALLRYYGRSDSRSAQFFVRVLASMNADSCYTSGLPDSHAQPSAPSVSKHLRVPNIAFARYPSAHWASHSLRVSLDFAIDMQARQSRRPNRVRHPTDGSFTSSCFPPCLATAQFLSVSGRRTYA
jgi:hypothetical protein